MSFPGVGPIDHVEMLDALDVKNVHLVGVDEVGFSCIFVDGHAFGDQNPSCHMNREHGAWRCKSCGRSGGLIEFVGAAIHGSPMDALRWLRKHFGDVYVEPKDGIASAVRERLRRPEAESGLSLPDEAATIGVDGIFYVNWRTDVDHPAYRYMVGRRGFDPNVLAMWHVGWDSYTRRVTIPYRDDQGVLVGFNARSVEDTHKLRYMVLGDDAVKQPRYGVGYGFDMMRIEDHIFGLYEATRALEDVPIHDREIVGMEGELNRIATPLPNVVSIGNAWMSDRQRLLLRLNASSLVLFLDSDPAGEAAVWGGYDEEKQRPVQGIVHQLSPFMRLRVVDDHEGDAASMGSEATIDLIAGAQPWLRAALR